MSSISKSNSVIGTSATFATLTAAYTGNQTNAINVLESPQLSLDVFFIPGATNQYIEVLIEESSKDTLPSADADWIIHPAQIASVGETAVYDNPWIVPGDKVSVTTATERQGISIDLATRCVRVSVREKTNAGGTPSTFGTCHLRFFKREVHA